MLKRVNAFGPGEDSLPIYPIKIEGEDILVNVDEPLQDNERLLQDS